MGDSGTYFQNFIFTAGVKLGDKNTLVTIKEKGRSSYQLDKEFHPLAFSSHGEATGSVVFAW
jgi:hypothetical protein